MQGFGNEQGGHTSPGLCVRRSSIGRQTDERRSHKASPGICEWHFFFPPGGPGDEFEHCDPGKGTTFPLRSPHSLQYCGLLSPNTELHPQQQHARQKIPIEPEWLSAAEHPHTDVKNMHQDKTSTLFVCRCPNPWPEIVQSEGYSFFIARPGVNTCTPSHSRFYILACCESRLCLNIPGEWEWFTQKGSGEEWKHIWQSPINHPWSHSIRTRSLAAASPTPTTSERRCDRPRCWRSVTSRLCIQIYTFINWTWSRSFGCICMQ